MRIRVQLALMMAAVVAPLVLVAAVSSYALLQIQREVHSQRYLERVRALRLALDTELQGTVRLLKTLAGRAAFAPAASGSDTELNDLLSSVLEQNPMWASIQVLDPNGGEIAGQHQPSAAPGPALDQDTRQRVLSSKEPAVSALVPAAGGRAFYTFVAVPELADGRVVRITAVGVHHYDWLAFLRKHPIADDATLTLNDQNGIIIARTLNNDQWVGKRLRQEYLDRIAERSENAMVNSIGMEGQTFYSAFSRLSAAPWALGTGVPATSVEAALRSQAGLMAIGLLLAALVAAGVAAVLGRDITRALHSLADASRVDVNGRPGADEPLKIDEAEAVRRLLRDTLAAETHARADAERAREQAVRANKGKDDFLAMLAHELRNPLSAIAASTALLDAKNATAQTHQHACDVLKRQVRQMSMLVNDLLDASRVNSGKLSLREADVDLAQLVASVVQAFRSSGRTRHLQVHTALQPVTVRGDATRLEQVVSNLLDNAAKFTGAGGQVNIALGVLDGLAMLTVTDNGAGIEPALLPGLFDPFTQAEAGLDRTRGGLGLGLHVVKGLVELHGGEVAVHSDGAGRGATFTVQLPAIASVGAAPVSRPAAEPEALPALRVALIEDNPDVGNATATLLRMAGHEVHSAFDGHSGLQLLMEDPPDVALIDVGLPGLNGLEVARRVPPGRIVLLALTAYGDAAMRTQALQAGFNGFLQKPFDLRSFELAVAAARAPA